MYGSPLKKNEESGRRLISYNFIINKDFQWVLCTRRHRACFCIFESPGKSEKKYVFFSIDAGWLPW